MGIYTNFGDTGFARINARLNGAHIAGNLNAIVCFPARPGSEHSFGMAIDVSAIDGAVVSKHWKDKGIKGDTLRKAASVACKHFSNVLTPETNRLHHNHFHLDSGVGFQCDARSKIGF